MKFDWKYFLMGIVMMNVLFLSGCDNVKDEDTKSSAHIKFLMLTVGKTILKKDENSTVQVIAVMKNSLEKDVTEEVTWEIFPEDAVKLENGRLIAKKDISTKIKAKIGTVESNEVDLTITWIVNGHTLPPEPDKALNDSTLLGIDVNVNRVRDDVERKVYATYPKAIQRAVMTQAFRTEQAMLADPDFIKNARVWAKDDTKAMDCDAYLYLHKNKPFIKKMGNIINDWQFNNEERVKLYIRYNKELSGGVYTINEGTLQDCEFDVDKVLGMDSSDR